MCDVCVLCGVCGVCMCVGCFFSCSDQVVAALKAIKDDTQKSRAAVVESSEVCGFLVPVISWVFHVSSTNLITGAHTCPMGMTGC